MNFNFELTENERLLMIMALGAAYGLPTIVADQTAPPATSIGLARRLMSVDVADLRAPAAVPQPQPAAPANTASAVSTASTAKPRMIPADAKEFHILPFSITKMGDGEKERLVVTGKSGGETKKASCWASCRDIWPRVLEKVKQPATFLVVEKSGYLNIVGVK